MKKLKNILVLSVLFVVAFTFISCEDDDKLDDQIADCNVKVAFENNELSLVISEGTDVTSYVITVDDQEVQLDDLSTFSLETLGITADGPHDVCITVSSSSCNAESCVSFVQTNGNNDGDVINEDDACSAVLVFDNNELSLTFNEALDASAYTITVDDADVQLDDLSNFSIEALGITKEGFHRVCVASVTPDCSANSCVAFQL